MHRNSINKFHFLENEKRSNGMVTIKTKVNIDSLNPELYFFKKIIITSAFIC